MTRRPWKQKGPRCQHGPSKDAACRPGQGYDRGCLTCKHLHFALARYVDEEPARCRLDHVNEDWPHRLHQDCRDWAPSSGHPEQARLSATSRDLERIVRQVVLLAKSNAMRDNFHNGVLTLGPSDFGNEVGAAILEMVQVLTAAAHSRALAGGAE